MTLPPLPYALWEPTKTTLHLYTQVVGKIRLQNSALQNHWWNVTLRPEVRGYPRNGCGPVMCFSRCLSISSIIVLSSRPTMEVPLSRSARASLNSTTRSLRCCANTESRLRSSVDLTAYRSRRRSRKTPNIVATMPRPLAAGGRSSAGRATSSKNSPLSFSGSKAYRSSSGTVSILRWVATTAVPRTGRQRPTRCRQKRTRTKSLPLAFGPAMRLRQHRHFTRIPRPNRRRCRHNRSPRAERGIHPAPDISVVSRTIAFANPPTRARRSLLFCAAVTLRASEVPIGMTGRSCIGREANSPRSRVHLASWKIIPSVKRSPLRNVLTPCLIVVRYIPVGDATGR